MSYRKEKKFRLSQFDFDSLKSKLLYYGMQPLYPKRVINSLYYDTRLYTMYHDSEEGVLPRRKVRFRWYNDVRKAKKELKISSIEGRFKTSTYVPIVSENTLPLTLHDQYYGVLYPSLKVTYIREYYLFKSMRITFDSQIKYVDYRRSSKISYKDIECVMEIKVSHEVSDDYIESKLPFPTSRFSKYSRGLLASNGEL